MKTVYVNFMIIHAPIRGCLARCNLLGTHWVSIEDKYVTDRPRVQVNQKDKFWSQTKRISVLSQPTTSGNVACAKGKK